MPLETSTPAPAVLQDLLRSLDLETENTPVFLNFFRSDCPWCQSEIPQLAHTYQRHKDLNLHFLGIAVGEETQETAEKFAAEKKLDFPVVSDTDGALRAAFAIERVPTIVVIGSNGSIACNFEGATEQLNGIVEQTIFATAHGTTPPEYHMTGNGCAP